MKAALILNGDEPSKKDLGLLDDVEVIVCADGAAQYMLTAGRVPTAIVGDLDSLEPEVYKWADAMSIPLERHPADKEYTDGELALLTVLKSNPTELLILGGHGGRSSMFMANLKILRAAQVSGVNAAMIGNGETLVIRFANENFDLSPFAGATFNVLPVGGDTEVSIQGAAFAGEHMMLLGASAKGVSNKVATEGPSSVSVHSGIGLIIVEQHLVD